MLLTRTFAYRRPTLVALAGALVICAFLAMPQGRVFASTLLLFFRGQVIQPVPTTYANLQNAYSTLEELEKLGQMKGTVPQSLDTVGSVSAAATMAGFTPAQPSTLPTGYSHTASGFKALPPSTVQLTFQATTANAYFKSIGSTQTLPAQLDGEQLIVSFPGVVVLEYANPAGGSVYVGQAGQLTVQVNGNATVDQVRSYLLTLPGLSSATVNSLKNITNWQTTIPLGIPTDRDGWTSTTVGGSFSGSGVILNDNTGIASAVLWQRSSGTQSLGVGGRGLTATQVQSIAGSLH
jgi:hypothetical protein